VVLAMVKLQDELRVAGARWNAGTNPIAGMPSERRRAYLGYVPGPDELSLKRREATSRINRMRRTATSPAPLGACDLRSSGHADFVGAARSAHPRPPCAVAIHTVVQTTFRLAVQDPRVELADFTATYIPDEPVGRAWLALPQPTTVIDVRGRGRIRIRRWRELHTADSMKQWLETHGPLLAVFTVHEDFYAYADGVYHHILGAFEGGHCAAVIGYDDGGEYWIAQNSWGASWGERGCFRIAFGERGIDASMWGVELQ